MQKEMEQLLFREGYRHCPAKPEEIGIFYKYYQEGFHIVLTVDLEHGYQLQKEQYEVIETKTKELFYHPQGKLLDFPEGFPVYHVEVLALLLGGSSETVRTLCGGLKNVWSYQPVEKRLVVYENQPGDFWGLRAAIEKLYGDGNPGTGTEDTGSGSTGTRDARTRNAGTNTGNRRGSQKRNGSYNMKTLPYITIILAALNVLVYIVLEIMGDTENGLFIASHGGMYPEFIHYNHEWWRILTSMFIHFGMVHLVNNMVIFCCVGSRLEHAVGHIRLLTIYLLSGICGGLLSYAVMFYSGDYAVSAGASGAVFGTIGGLLWAVIWNKGHFEGLTTRGLILMIALSLYYGFSTIGVDNWCHIGGIIAGFTVTAILYHGKRQRC